MELEYGYDVSNATFYVVVDKLHKAVITYTDENGVWNLDHTLVPSELSGKGIGGKLAKYVFDYIDMNNIKYRATCSFLLSYIQKNNIR